jgi:hypothetical protein
MFGIGKGAGKAVNETLGGVSKILDKVVTTQVERGKIDIAFNELQTKINELESQNGSLFVSGWRPFVGWVCGIGIGFNFVIRPMVNYLLMVFSPETKLMESLEMGVLSTLITGMLGFGAIRTYEKVKNKHRN